MNLNTSHVILYLKEEVQANDEPKFKYISCYSLSRLWVVSPPGEEFKYISCYSLSVIGKYICNFHINLNTSHVILYRATAY